MIDREIHLARALLVEGNPLMRSITTAQLRDAGVGQVTSVGRIKEARLALEHDRFDIVVCSREFEDSTDSGQDLLDELRRENQLPHSTVFLMVCGQATYLQVVEAAESALDGLLVRPYTAAALAQRLQEARHRKRELGDILRALDAGQTEAAYARALKRFLEHQPYGTYCGRLAAELALELHRQDDSRRIFEKLVELKDASWARLGLARALIAAGDTTAARRVVDTVLASEPGSADAHDLAGRLLVEQCDFEGALQEYRSAAGITPGCLLRAQHVGALAFYQGHGDEALKMLERTLGMGVQSKLFDALSLLLIALLRFDAGNAAGVASMRDQLRSYRERFPDSLRLQRFEQSAQVLVDLQRGAAPGGLQQLSEQAGHDDFDLESANMLLALWARVPEGQRPSGGHAEVLERLALRFCVSKAIVEVLVAAARREEPAEAVIRRCQSQVSRLAEQAMERALAGDPAVAVQALLAEGERTLNARLLEMAGLIARRHQAVLPDAQALAARAATLVQRSCKAVNHIAGIQRSGRSPGGLQLRGRTTTESGHPAT